MYNRKSSDDWFGSGWYGISIELPINSLIRIRIGGNMTQLEKFIESRNDALVAYGMSGETADKARYNKSVRLLREYCNENNINLTENEIDVLMYETSTLKKEKPTDKLDLSGMDENFDDDYM